MTHSEIETIKTVAALAAMIGVAGAFLISDHDPAVRLMGWMLCGGIVVWALGFGCCLLWLGRRK